MISSWVIYKKQSLEKGYCLFYFVLGFCMFYKCWKSALQSFHCSKHFWWQHWNTVCNMTGQFKTLILSQGEKRIWIICSSETVKYYCEITIYYVIVKFTISMAVNSSMFKCKEFNLAKANEAIFSLQDTGTWSRMHLPF